MTIKRDQISIQELSTTKCIPKKSVAFTKVSKFQNKRSSLSKNGMTPVFVYGDAALQSPDTRRKYMRRGSKAPSMMFFTKDDRSRLEEEFPDIDVVQPLALVTQQQHQQQRRHSIMTVLKCHFDQVNLLDNIPKFSAMRRMSFESDASRYSLDVVSIFK